jgi:hypothetical protein
MPRTAIGALVLLAAATVAIHAAAQQQNASGVPNASGFLKARNREGLPANELPLAVDALQARAVRGQERNVRTESVSLGIEYAAST